MRLIVECEHGQEQAHPVGPVPSVHAFEASTLGERVFDPKREEWCQPKTITDPDAILEALAEAGVLQREWLRYVSPKESRYVSHWKQAK